MKWKALVTLDLKQPRPSADSVSGSVREKFNAHLAAQNWKKLKTDTTWELVWPEVVQLSGAKKSVAKGINAAIEVANKNEKTGLIRSFAVTAEFSHNEDTSLKFDQTTIGKILA